MAYNRTFNPDALPAFAEPERKQSADKNSSTYPPRGSSQSHSPPNNDPYGNKPPPPLPRQDNIRGNAAYGAPAPGRQPSPDYRGNTYGGPGPGRQPSPDHRGNTYGGPGPGRQASPVMQPMGNYGYGSSPPPNNGRFPPPNNTSGWQAQASRLPPSPASGAGSADPSLLPLFRAVDKNGSGQLSEKQLGAALVNGDWTFFDTYTIRLMIRMFDTDGSGTIGYDEFCGLWSFLASWRTLFDRFDIDRSGNISLDEFTNALVAFGYRLTPEFIRFLFAQYDKTRTNQLSFDLFVQACISLKRMTDVFKRYDDDRDGFIQLSFEEFLTVILKQR